MSLVWVVQRARRLSYFVVVGPQAEAEEERVAKERQAMDKVMRTNSDKELKGERTAEEGCGRKESRKGARGEGNKKRV